MIKIYAALGAVAVVAGLSFGWYQSSLRLDIAQAERDKATQAVAAFSKTLESERRDAIKSEENNRKNLEALRNAKDKIEAMRVAVDSGTGELHINAECAAARELPKAATGVSKPDASSARLTDTAKRNYFLLRERHEEAIAQILGLQVYIKDYCQTKKSPD